MYTLEAKLSLSIINTEAFIPKLKCATARHTLISKLGTATKEFLGAHFHNVPLRISFAF